MIFTKKQLMAILTLSATALLWGCGSSGGGSDDPAPPPRVIAYTGSGGCIACHEDYDFSADIVAGYLASKHLVHSTEIHAASDPSCLECHDPRKDGLVLAALIDDANVPEDGLAAVGCEDCHGAGGEHFGVGPLPTARPGVDACAQCHQELPPGPLGHLSNLAGNLVANYRAGAHAGSQAGSSALCDRCHSDEGFRAFASTTAGLDGAQLQASLNGAARPATRSPIQCRTCHDSHSGELRSAATLATGGDRSIVTFSQEFNLCTACHQVALAADFDPTSETYSYRLDVAVSTYLAAGHPVPGARIDDTHFADPASGIAGYNINAAAANACTACHDAHGATKFGQAGAAAIAEDWAGSGHGDYQGEAFAHDFTDPSCLKCHSGPEYARFVQGAAPANLELSGGGQVVACGACHDTLARDAGGAFALGALRPVANVTFPSGATVSLDGLSNLCLECHQGRSSTPTLNERIAAGNLAFSNIHYFAAGAVLFGSEVQGGYEYAGNSYRGKNAFVAHTLSGRPDLTTCTGCHLRGDEVNHGFAVDMSDCADCHVGGSFATLSGSPRYNATAIQQLKDQLLQLLTASGVAAVEGYPYFQNITTVQQLRAAYNWQVADKEPGGYIHNGPYLRQLLFDSITDMGGTPVVPRQ